MKHLKMFMQDEEGASAVEYSPHCGCHHSVSPGSRWHVEHRPDPSGGNLIETLSGRAALGEGRIGSPNPFLPSPIALRKARGFYPNQS